MKNINITKIFSVCFVFILLLSFIYTAPSSSAATASLINDGDTIRVVGTKDVYIVKILGAALNQKKFKRLVLNEQIFNSYGQLSWSKIKDVSQGTMDQFANSNLVIHVNADGSAVDSKIWSVTSSVNSDRGVKKLLNVTAEQLIRSGIDQSSAFNINDLEAGDSFYSTGVALSSSDDLIAWAINARGSSDSSVAHKSTVLGRVTDDTSNAISGIILTCNSKTLATTDSEGYYSFQINIGDGYCIRVSNAPSNSKVHAINNRLNSNYNSYEYQLAGRSATSTDNTFEQGADRNTDSGMDFVIFKQTAAPVTQVPTITSIVPTSITAGGSDFTLDVNGSNFNGFSSIVWGGSTAFSTQFLSITHLAAVIPAQFTAWGSTVAISVNNTGQGGGSSSSHTLTINNPVPVVADISPSTLAVGSGNFTITINGNGFVPTSVVTWQGAARATTFVSSTSLTAQINASDISSAGSAQVTVTSPSPGGGTSTVKTFTIIQI